MTQNLQFCETSVTLRVARRMKAVTAVVRCHKSALLHLANVLGTLKGRFILSLNDRPEVRETFAGFRFETVNTTYTIATKRAAPRAEVLISNYPLPMGVAK
jgi:hypothetical protein